MNRFRVVILPALVAAGMAMGAAFSVGASEPSAMVAGQFARWKIWGGEVTFRWNRDLMTHLGVTVSPGISGSRADMYGREEFAIGDASALDFAVNEGGFGGFTGGALIVRGGFHLDAGNERIVFRDLRLVPRSDDGFILDVVSGDGAAWFYIDRMMYVVEGGEVPVLAIKTMDLRIAPALAQRLGSPLVAGLAVADLSMHTRIHSEGGDITLFQPSGGSSKWPGDSVPGVQGAYYQADVFMHHFTTQFMRGSNMTGPSGSGKVVFTPSSTLRNNRNNGSSQPTFPSQSGQYPASDPLGTSTALYAADIVWNDRKRNPSPVTPPYSNDQHPYLIWNLYRIDATGRIEQIGRSGVKHAFLTTNTSCDQNPGTGYILGRGCVDTYGTGNNDYAPDLGPRSEIIPATGQWGRCGSVFDADCNGVMDAGQPCSNISGVPSCSTWVFRMQVDERDISPTVNPDAAYWFESWYIVRDDIDIYNTMQTRPATFNWGSGMWEVGQGSGTELKLGPAIDRWLARGTSTATERSSDIETVHGQARLAVKVTALEGGGWRYDYVVANFDFAVAETSGSEPNLRVLSNAGFTHFEVTAQTGTPVVAASGFSDGDRDVTNDWGFTQAGALLRWSQGSGESVSVVANPLNWGTMYRFSVESAAAPVVGTANLRAPAGFSIDVETLVPDGTQGELSPLFSDGFESDPVME